MNVNVMLHVIVLIISVYIVLNIYVIRTHNAIIRAVTIICLVLVSV
jgi:hypothetical protein